MCDYTDPEGVRSLLNSLEVESWTIGKVVEGTGKSLAEWAHFGIDLMCIDCVFETKIQT